MSDIIKLLDKKTKYEQSVDSNLFKIVNARKVLTEPEVVAISNWLTISDSVNKKNAKIESLMTKIIDVMATEAESSEGGEEVEEEEVEETKAKRKRTDPATETEKTLVQVKLKLGKDTAEIYDAAGLDDFCKKNEVTYGDGDDLKRLMMAVMFLGFRAADVFNKLRKGAMDAGISKDMFIYHMRVFCAIYSERGSAFLWRGLMTIKNKPVRTYINALVKVYDVVKRRPSGGYAPDDVTITRIVALFPDLVMAILKESAKVPIASEISPTIKPHFKFPGGASLIPKSKKDEFAAWLIWYKAFGKVINRGKEPTDDEVRRYGEAIHNSDVVSEEKRLAIWAVNSV